MKNSTVSPSPLLRSRKSVTGAMLAIAVIALGGQIGGQTQAPATVQYSRGYLVTGDYVVSGVDLPPGGGTGTINFTGTNTVPAGAEVIAAWAIWETIEPEANTQLTSAQFRGEPIDVAKVFRVTTLPGTGSSCWGSTGNANPFLTTYRVDVLHMLPKKYDLDGKWTGTYLVNDADLIANGKDLHTIALPTIGTGNTTTTSAGASLLLVWRDPSPSAALRKIVMYDGAAIQAQAAITSHTLAGFYKASASPSAKLSYIVGTGADNVNERVLFNGAVLETNPFARPIGAGSDRGWSTRTFDVSAQMANLPVDPLFPTADFGQVVTTRVDHGQNVNAQSSTPYECISVASIIFSTTVADTDNDGLPDGIEDDADGLKDPPTPVFPAGEPLPNLAAMGAFVGQRDLFVEINATRTPANTSPSNPVTYGAPDAPYSSTTVTVSDTEGHDHMPGHAVLKMVGDAYAAAPNGGIKVHFDVGDLAQYRALGPDYACPVGEVDCDKYFVTTGARGGERIEERACEDCQFAAFPGTVGWPYGFRMYRDAPVADDGTEVTTVAEIQEGAPEEGELRRRFDRIRQPYIHYALFAHARGKAKSAFPCLDEAGAETGFDPDTPGVCEGTPPRNNPLFHVPTSTSGVAELPGGSLMVSLGLWDTNKFVASKFVQASTFFHELGHNLNLWHGGAPAVFGNATTATQVEPNCKPNYQSSMSYLFQVHGLVNNAGQLNLDYSGTLHSPLDETSLSNGLSPGPKYRAAWFAPLDSALATSQGGAAARRFCNGAPFDPDAPPAPMTRVLAASTASILHWDGDSVHAPGEGHLTELDINFDGFGTDLVGFNDWNNVRLNQISGGRTPRVFKSNNEYRLDYSSGDLLDFGTGDLLEFGTGDLLEFGAGSHIVHFGSGNYFSYLEGDLLEFGTGDLLEFGTGDLLEFGTGALMLVHADANDGDLLEFGTGDLLEFGTGDLLEFGTGDLLEFGTGDLLEFGTGDLLEFGTGDLLEFGTGTGAQELDLTAAFGIAFPRPTGLTGCVLGVDCAGPQPYEQYYHRVQLDWDAPSFGEDLLRRYDVYRAVGNVAPQLVGSVPRVGVNPPDTTFIDEEELPNGVTFIYTVRAVYEDGTVNGAESAHSDPTSEQAVNEAPVALNDSNYQTKKNTQLTVAAPGVLTNDIASPTFDVDSPPTSRAVVVALTSKPSSGTLNLNANGSFTFKPKNGFTGTVTFTYAADNGLWTGDPRNPKAKLSGPSSPATVTITVVP